MGGRTDTLKWAQMLTLIKKIYTLRTHVSMDTLTQIFTLTDTKYLNRFNEYFLMFQMKAKILNTLEWHI